MKTLRAVALLWAAVALSLAAPGWAKKPKDQPNIRSVQGVVTDISGKAVPGAVVNLENTKTLQIRSFIAKNDGTYTFHGLSTNVDYELKAESQTAVSDVKTLSVFDSRRNAVINLKLNKKK